MTPAVIELLLRHELGDFPPRVRARLDEIFRTNPADAVERLERAAAYLGLTATTRGTLERADALARRRSRTLAHEKTDTGEKEVAGWREHEKDDDA